MESDLEGINQQYRRQIRPLFEMLKHKQAELTDTDWKNRVRKTEHDVMNSPDQYLSDLPKKDVLDLIIHNLFDEFLKESIYRPDGGGNVT